MSAQKSIAKELRVLHISAQKSWRGGEQQVSYLINELNILNCKQWVLCADGNAMSSYCEKNNIPFYIYKKQFSGAFTSQKIVRKICDQHAIDLIHVHDSKSHTLAFISAVFGNAMPIIVSRRVDFPVGNSLLSRWKYNNRYIAKYICVSQKIKEILEKGVKDHSKIEVVHSGIDVSRFAHVKSKGILRKEFNIDQNELVIGNIAALADHKDYFTFIDTAEILKSTGLKAKYLVVGDGPLEDEIRQYTRAKAMSKDVIFTGFRKDIPSVLVEFDFFLFTSKTEGLGTSILDAMACRVPVVCTNAGGIPEIISHEVNGLLSSVGDSSSLAQSIIRLVNDISLREKLSLKALETLQHFSTKNTASKTYNIYLTHTSSHV